MLRDCTLAKCQDFTLTDCKRWSRYHDAHWIFIPWILFLLYDRFCFLLPRSFRASLCHFSLQGSFCHFPTLHFELGICRFSLSRYDYLFRVPHILLFPFLSSVCAVAIRLNLPGQCFRGASRAVPLGLCYCVGDNCLDNAAAYVVLPHGRL